MFGVLRLRRRRLRRFAAMLERNVSPLIGSAILLLLWLAIGAAYLGERHQDYQHARQRIEDHTLLFEENVLRAIGEIDKTIFYVRRIIEQRLGEVDYRQLVSRDDIQSDVIVQVAIIDQNGIMRASSSDPAAPTIDLSDREHFSVHATGTRDFLFMSRPLVGRASKKWSVQFTRRLTDRTRAFAGVVVASLSPDHFTKLYKQVDLGSDSSIALVGSDGVVRASGGAERYQLGADVKATPLMVQIARGANDVVELSESRLVAIRHLHSHGLAVVLDIPLKNVFAAAQLQLVRNAIGGGLISIVIASIITWGVRYQKNLAIAQRRLLRHRRRAQRQSAQLAMTLENITQGLLLVSRNGQLPIINKRAMELLDVPPSFISQRPTFARLVAFLEERGEFEGMVTPEGTPHRSVIKDSNCHYERVSASGRVLEIRSRELPDGGSVWTMSDITHLRKAQEVIARLASQDSLTGLVNRRQFESCLNSSADRCASDGQHHFALFCLDLDRFKSVNDTFGHQAGDQLLKLAAGRIKAAVRATDVVARLGGDEFAIISDVAPEDAAPIAARLVESLARPFDLNGQRALISASIGVACAPNDGVSPEAILTAADTALYAVKGAGRNGFRVFDASMLDELRMRHRLETDLREAVAAGDQMRLHYQPLVDLETGKVAAFEALMRWQHPSRGMIPPGEFIPIAEETGLIAQLGNWAIGEACRAAIAWPGSIRVAVNVSSVQLDDRCLLDVIDMNLDATGLAPNRLELEITESVLMRDCEHVMTLLHELTQKGICLSLDDFGTGYSSLSYLCNFPLSKIKIDRSFVSTIDGSSDRQVIVRSIVDIGRSLSMTTVAEGIETAQQLTQLKALGCTEGQGYLFSKPVPASQIPELIERLEGGHGRAAAA